MHLSYQEHINIYRGLCEQKSAGAIAKIIGRVTSTVTREIARNSDHIGYLYPLDAYRRQEQKRKKQRQTKIDKNQKLKNYIIKKLKIKWSPKVIAGRWKMENPTENITHESIYTWLYQKGNECFRKLLPRAKAKRGFVRKPKKSHIRDRISIHDRPENINNRSISGHFEGDLVFHKGSMSKNILTVIERKSRYAFLIKNSSKHSEKIIGKLADAVFPHKAQSITFDNGSEFSSHYTLNYSVKTYFCNPGSPWQKGSIENFNGLLRRRLPFKVPLDLIDQSTLDAIAHRINHTPREILNFLTPCEAFQSESKQCCVS